MYVIATAALMLGSETHPEPQTVLQELYLSESLNLQKNGFHQSLQNLCCPGMC